MSVAEPAPAPGLLESLKGGIQEAKRQDPKTFYVIAGIFGLVLVTRLLR